MATEFIVSAKLIADASALKTGAAEGKAALAGIGEGAASATPKATALATAIAGIDKATHPVLGSAKALNAVLADAKVQYEAGALSANAYAKVMEVANRKSKEFSQNTIQVGQSLRATKAASANLGQQFGDIAQQMAMGVNPATVLGQQLGQVAFAAKDMGGKLGAVAGFLSTGWGAAIQFGIIVLGSLASSFFRSGEAAKKSASATDIHKMSLEDLKKAIDDENAALGKTIQTSRQAEEASLKAAESKRIEVRDRRAHIVSLLEEARELDRINKIRSQAPGERGEIAALGLQQSAQNVGAIEAQLAIATAALKTAEQNVTRAVIPVLQRNSSVRLDPRTRADEEYNQGIARLNQQLDIAVRAGANRTLAEHTYSLALDRLSKAHTRELKEIEDRQTRARQQDRENARTIVFQMPVNGQVTSGFGPRVAPKPGASTFHPGIDIAVPIGTQVRAPAAGVVIRTGTYGGLGNVVWIDHGSGTITELGHLSRALVAKGDQVSAGQVVALSGNSGLSTGPHVDYRVSVGGKFVDPRKGRFKANTGDAVHDIQDDIERDTKRAAEEAKRALEELQRELGVVVGAFDPATAAAKKYADQLDRIAELNRKGFLSDAQAISLGIEASRQQMEAQRKADSALIDKASGGDFAKSWEETMDTARADVALRMGNSFEEAGKRGAKALRDDGLAAAEAISRLLGKKIGGSLGDAFGILGGLKTGNFNSINSPLGSILTLLSSKREEGQPPDPFNEGLREFINPIKHGLKEVVGKIGDTFKIGGDFEKTLGHAAGGAALGAVVGPAVTKLLGLKSSKAGGEIGGAVGAAAGAASGIPGGAQIGAIIGSIEGSIVGGLLKKSKTGSATITNITGDAAIGGNNVASKDAAKTISSGIQSALSQIADALGGQLGPFALSVGMKDGNFRLDPTGKGNVKTKKGAVDFGKDQNALFAAALVDAIADGGVTGLSAAVRKALTSSTDVDKALREALKVDEVETLLAGVGGAMAKQFKDFERQAAERVRIAQQYGFDVVAIEKRTAEDRAKLMDDILGSRIGALKDFLDEVRIGGLFEGSAADQRNALLVERDKAQADAEAGVDGAADKLADLSRRLLELSRDAFGTAGGEFASDRQTAISGAQRVIDLENERAKAAADAAKETNAQLNELNDQAAVQTALLRAIAANTSGNGGGGGGGTFTGASTAFHGSLSL